jgi:hypothetical protein
VLFLLAVQDWRPVCASADRRDFGRFGVEIPAALTVKMRLILCAVGLWAVTMASYALFTLEQSQTLGETNLNAAAVIMISVRIMVASAIGGCVCFVRWLHHR